MKRTRVLLVAVLAAGLVPAAAQEDPDLRKSGSALYAEGFRLETERPIDLQKAIAKYRKAADKGPAEVAAAALVRMGYCYEKLEPENVDEALSSYRRAADEFGSVEPWGRVAREKVALNGVDVYLRRLHSHLRAWRDRRALSPADLDAQKEAAWENIRSKDREAVDGLLWGLRHEDAVIRDFCADKLAEVVDGDGVARVIETLNDENPAARAGAAQALRRIFKKFNDAAELDRQASNLRRDTEISMAEVTPRAQESIARVRPVIDSLEQRANEIRHNIPNEPDKVPAIQSALERIIGDEAADPVARREAAAAAAWIGPISGGLADALVAGMGSSDRGVREASCRAAGAVDTASGSDKHKLADRLTAILAYEPVRPASDDNVPPSGDPSDHPDWANDEIVRQAAAEALERIALVRSLPALIKALGDNDGRVRHAAYNALRQITRRSFDYEPDAPLKAREEARQRWQDWWEETDGIVVLVERFWIFQSQWKDAAMVRLFDREAFLGEVESTLWASPDPKSDRERAERVVDTFQRLKDVFVQDAVDAGASAFARLLEFVGGETVLEDRDRQEPRPNAATRAFVAEALARIVDAHDLSDGPEQIRGRLLSGGSAAQKAGAALALGFLPKARTGAADRDALARGLGDGDPIVREAAAVALARIGEEANTADLARTVRDADRRVQVASLRAIAALSPRNDEVLRALAEIVADEPARGEPLSSRKSPEPEVREHAAAALGASRQASTIRALLRARRDTMRNVREAARTAIRTVFEADRDGALEQALSVFRDEKQKSDDRIGAALSLGDMHHPRSARELATRLRDPNPPRFLRDQDPAVRMAICQALAALKASSRPAVQALVEAMADEEEREGVRDNAYLALKTITGGDPPGGTFSASNPRERRESAVRAWQAWLETASLQDE